MNTKNTKAENKKSLNDLKKQSIDGSNVLGGGVSKSSTVAEDNPIFQPNPGPMNNVL